MKEKPKTITPTALKKERGWTDSMIKNFLGEPDSKVKHYIYGNISLYLEKRVVKAERKPEFLIAKAKASKRKKAGLLAAETKREKLINYINKTKINLKILPKEKVIKKAINAYNDFNAWKEDHEFATIKSDEKFLNRIAVNYIRHELTNYDFTLPKIFGKVGKDQALGLLRQRIYKKIGKRYPYFAAECKRQMAYRTI